MVDKIGNKIRRDGRENTYTYVPVHTGTFVGYYLLDSLRFVQRDFSLPDNLFSNAGRRDILPGRG